MGLFDNFPYSNFHELNLDWVLKVLKDIETTIDQFVSLNIIKYADPIQWDITRQYPKNTIVIDPISGTAYISVDNVPQGVALSNSDYWSVVFDLGRFITLASSNFADSYEEVLTTTATVPTDEGHWVVWNSILYEALNDIHVGDRYVEDGNIKRRTVEYFYDRMLSQITQEIANRIAAINAEESARIAADTALQNNINAEESARIAADTALQNNINAEESARIAADAALQNNITEEETTRANQDFTLNTRIDEEANNRYEADQSILGMINDVRSLAMKRRLQGKKIHIFGDSISDQDWSGSGVSPAGKLPVWVDYFQQSLSGVATVTNDSEVGRMMVQLPLILDNYNSIDADIVIVELGTNDFNNNIPLGNYNANTTCFAAAVGNSFVKIGQLTDYKAEIWFITPFTRHFTYGINNNHVTLECYRQCIIGFMKHWGGCWINGDSVPRMSSFFDALYDGIHPRAEFNPSLAGYIESCLESFKCDVEFTNNSYFGDISDIIDHTKFNYNSSIRYYMNGQTIIFEGMLEPTNGNITVGDYIITTDLGDILQLVMPARYQPAACFINDTSDSCCPAFVFVSDNKLCWRIDHDRTNTLQFSFKYEYEPNWCNVFTDGMA